MDGITYDDLYQLGKEAGRAELLNEIAAREIEILDEKERQKLEAENECKSNSRAVL